MGMAMQGSGITSVDVGSASLKINDDGFYTLSIGAADKMCIRDSTNIVQNNADIDSEMQNAQDTVEFNIAG